MAGNSSRRRGRARELEYADKLREDGYVVYRIDGCADLIAMKARERDALIQVKSTVTPYSHFGPKDRTALLEQAKRAGAYAVLVWWPRGRGIKDAQWIDSAVWP